jgi:hypothetical protein
MYRLDAINETMVGQNEVRDMIFIEMTGLQDKRKIWIEQLNRGMNFATIPRSIVESVSA